MAGAKLNIHVIPMGLELDRILGGLKRYPTNRMIMIFGRNSTSDIERRARINGSRIKEMVNATIDVEEMEMDLFDFYTSTRGLNNLFGELEKEGYTVYVNLSTSTRIISSAALVAAFMTGAHPYYVSPERYSIPEDQEVMSVGVRRVFELPTVRIAGPNESEGAVLLTLGRLGGGIKRESVLIQPLEELGNFFDERRETEGKKPYLARKRAYLSRMLKNLEKEGYVRLAKRGRYVQVSLTESGQLFAGPPDGEGPNG